MKVLNQSLFFLLLSVSLLNLVSCGSDNDTESNSTDSRSAPPPPSAPATTNPISQGNLAANACLTKQQIISGVKNESFKSPQTDFEFYDFISVKSGCFFCKTDNFAIYSFKRNLSELFQGPASNQISIFNLTTTSLPSSFEEIEKQSVKDHLLEIVENGERSEYLTVQIFPNNQACSNGQTPITKLLRTEY